VSKQISVGLAEIVGELDGGDDGELEGGADFVGEFVIVGEVVRVRGRV
jgi:hypothetical protein